MASLYIYVLNLLAVLALVLANAFFVVSEFSIVKVRRTRLEELARKGLRKARIALLVNHHLDSYLSAIQLGITIASLGLGWIGEPAIARMLEAAFGSLARGNEVLLHSVSFGVSFAFITLLHVVVGELIPKSVAIQRTERLALSIAYPLYLFHRVFYPVIWVFDRLAEGSLRLMGIKSAGERDNAHTEEEIRMIVSASQRGGIIDSTEGEIIKNAIDFSDIYAHEVMIPRQDIQCLFTDDSFDDVMELVKGSRHTRYPLCLGDKDNILGMVHMRDLFVNSAQKPAGDKLKDIAREILFVPENKPISEILHQMMKKRVHLAVVVDEYGGTAGLLSMEDILEELVGEIMDEHDAMAEESMKREDGGVFEFDGAVLLDDACGFMKSARPEHEESTVGGYVFGLLGRAPKMGDKAEDDIYEFEVVGVKRMRITKVKVRKKG